MKAMLWALNEAPVTDRVQKLILIAMADYAHEDGTHCYPSQATIAAKALCSDRTVRTHLADMEAAGLIRRGDQSPAAGIPENRRPVVYELCMNLSTPVDNLAGNSFRPEADDAQAGNSGASGRKLASDKPNTNQEINLRASRPRQEISTPGQPPTLAALRAAERDLCEHEAVRSRCALCRLAEQGS